VRCRHLRVEVDIPLHDLGELLGLLLLGIEDLRLRRRRRNVSDNPIAISLFLVEVFLNFLDLANWLVDSRLMHDEGMIFEGLLKLVIAFDYGGVHEGLLLRNMRQLDRHGAVEGLLQARLRDELLLEGFLALVQSAVVVEGLRLLNLLVVLVGEGQLADVLDV